MRIYNQAACYGKALNVLQDDCNILSCQKAGMLKKVEQLQINALTWCCRWGGHLLAFISATTICEAGHSDKWKEELLEHATNGQCLLFELTSMVK